MVPFPRFASVYYGRVAITARGHTALRSCTRGGVIECSTSPPPDTCPHGNHCRGHLPPYRTLTLNPNRHLTLITLTLGLRLHYLDLLWICCGFGFEPNQGQMSQGGQMSGVTGVIDGCWPGRAIACIAARRTSICLCDDLQLRRASCAVGPLAGCMAHEAWPPSV